MLVAEQLLKAGASINSLNHLGFAPVILAAKQGHLTVVEVTGSVVHQCTNTMSLVQFLLRHGAASGDIAKLPASHPIWCPTRRSKGSTPLPILHQAAASGHALLVDALLRGQDAEQLCVSMDGRQWTPLHWAAERGYSEVIRMLVKRGAVLDMRSSRDLATPLHLAVNRKQTEAVRTLLELGASANPQQATMLLKRDRSGQVGSERPISIALKSENYRVVQLLIEHGAELTGTSYPLHHLCRNIVANDTDRVDCIRYFITHHPEDASMQNSKGETPFAVLLTNTPSAPVLQIATMLIAAGAKAPVLISGGALEMLFLWAASHTTKNPQAPGRIQEFIALLNLLTDAYGTEYLRLQLWMQSTYSHENCMQLAVTFPPELLKYVIERTGIDLRTYRTLQGASIMHLWVQATSVHLSSKQWHPQAEVLLELGADINAEDDAGLTPLHMVVARVGDLDEELITFFLKHGADLNHISSRDRFSFIWNLVLYGSRLLGRLEEPSRTKLYMNVVKLVEMGADICYEVPGKGNIYEYLQSQDSDPKRLLLPFLKNLIEEQKIKKKS